jgi:uncharacterized membrane protein YbhN (UPF0104 family)
MTEPSVVETFGVKVAAISPSVPAPASVVSTVRSGWRRVGGLALLLAGVIGAVVTLGGLARTGRNVDWADLLASPGWLSLIVVAVVIGYVCQSVSLALLLPGRLSWSQRLALPWANASVNRVTPAATGGLWLSSRVFRREGVSVGGATVTLCVLNATHTLGGVAIGVLAMTAGGAALPHGMSLPYLPPWLLPALIAVVAISLLGGRRIRTRVFGLLRDGRKEVSLRSAGAVVIMQAGARFAPVIVLAAVLAAFGHPLPLATVVLIEVVAGTSGNAIPLPGGGGGVELATTALLTASGVPFGAASAAVLAYRLLAYWLPALIGLPALLALRTTCAAHEAAELERAHDARRLPVPVVVSALVPLPALAGV